ncbi:isopeptide-forming domain-containing fimbrial protein [Bifidobacterium erythrocebi]|nr:isopeptide-forming domain-containing fimbrial protein [Bifidobacterium sp. DSM 109960]
MKRVISGLAALGIALSGMALGASSAWAADGGGSGEITSEAQTAEGTITITNAGGDTAEHQFSGYHLGWFYAAASDTKAEAGFTYQMATDPAHTSEIEAAMKEVKDDVHTDKSLYELYSQDNNYFVSADDTAENNPMGWIMANVSDKTTGGKTQLTDWSKQDSTALRQLANALKKNLTNPEYATAEGKTPLKSSSTGYSNPVNQGYYLLVETTDLASTNAGETASTADPSSAKSTQSIPILVASTIPNEAMLDSTKDSVKSDKVGKVSLKSSQPQIAKQVVDAKGKSVDNPDYNIGDDIYYELTTVIPDYTSYAKCSTYSVGDADCRKLIVTDTAEKGLTIQGVESVKVGDTPLTSEKYSTDSSTKVTYDGKTADDSNPADATKTTIDLGAYVNSDAVANNYGKTVTIIVKAKLNKDAKISTPTSNVPNKNKVELTYSNKFDDVNDAKTIPGGEVNVYTFKFKLNKTNMDGTALTKPEGAGDDWHGATFVVSEKDGNYLVKSDSGEWTTTANKDQATKFISDKDGNVTGFDGLKQGTYTVEETSAATGYTNFDLPSFDITITPVYQQDTSSKPNGATTWGDYELTEEEVSLDAKSDTRIDQAEDGNSFTINVKNAKNLTELPMTGGAGLVAVIAAGVLLAGAGVAAAVRSRKSNSRAVRI